MKLLEISIETYFKTFDGNIYFQRDGLPIGKSISKAVAVISNACTGLRKLTCLGRTAGSKKI